MGNLKVKAHVMYDVKFEKLLVEFEQPIDHKVSEALMMYKAESASLVIDPDTHELWGIEIPVKDDATDEKV